MKNAFLYLLFISFPVCFLACENSARELNPDLSGMLQGEYEGDVSLEIILDGFNSGSFQQGNLMEIRKVSDTEINVYTFHNSWKYLFTGELIRYEESIGIKVKDMIHGPISLTGRNLEGKEVHGYFDDNTHGLLFRLEYYFEDEEEPVHLISTFSGIKINGSNGEDDN